MQALDPSGTYTDAEVIDALTGRYGTRLMRYRYDRLNAANTYVEPLEGVVAAASVANNALADIKRTAKFAIVDRGSLNYLSDRIKPWAILDMPDGGVVEWPLGVFLLSTPDRALSTVGTVTRDVTAYDQLVVLRDDKVETRYSVAAGVAYTTAIATLIASVGGIAAAITPSALTLPATMEWEPGTSKLRILNDMLGAINYGSAWFNEAGTLICQPYQSPTERPVEYTYTDRERTSVRRGPATQTLDLFGVANKWVLVKGEPDEVPLVSTYTNTSETSPTSTVNRGRTIVDFRTEQDAADQATLDAKAARLAFEASQVYEGVKFDTIVMPMHSNADVVALDIPGLSIEAKYSEQSWAFNLEAGATMSHVVRRVVNV